MLDLLPPPRTGSRLPLRATAAAALPRCPVHPNSLVRRYRAQGPNGPGLYPQCVPGGSEHPHLLSWSGGWLPEAPPGRLAIPRLTPTECEMLLDAAEGLTSAQSARRRHKSRETVKTQRKQVVLKLRARNMTNAVALAASAERIPEFRA